MMEARTEDRYFPATQPVQTWPQTPLPNAFATGVYQQPCIVATRCQRTREELHGLLECSEFGKNTAMFCMYFRPPPNPGDPPMCNICGMPIAHHASGAAHLVDPNALPGGMVRDGFTDRFEHSTAAILFLSVGFLLFVVVMAVLFIVLSSSSRGGLIAPTCMFTLGFIFPTFFAYTIRTSFDRSRREFHYEKKWIVWRCFSVFRDGPFANIVGIESEERRGKRGVYYGISLKLRDSSEPFVIQDGVSAKDFPQQFTAWNMYLQRCIQSEL